MSSLLSGLDLRERRVAMAVCGGIAAYKAIDVLRILTEAGAEVKGLYEFQVVNGQVMRFMPCFCGKNWPQSPRSSRVVVGVGIASVCLLGAG